MILVKIESPVKRLVPSYLGNQILTSLIDPSHFLLTPQYRIITWNVQRIGYLVMRTSLTLRKTKAKLTKRLDPSTKMDQEVSKIDRFNLTLTIWKSFLSHCLQIAFLVHALQYITCLHVYQTSHDISEPCYLCNFQNTA